MKGDTIKYRKGYKYQLDEAYIVKTDVLGFSIDTEFIGLDSLGFLVIKRGYAWDGASGPTVDTDDTFRGSLVHDVFYQLMREKFIPLTWRKHADDILRTMLVEDGMWKLRALLWHDALFVVGEPAADPKHDKKVYTAP